MSLFNSVMGCSRNEGGKHGWNARLPKEIKTESPRTAHYAEEERWLTESAASEIGYFAVTKYL